MRAKPRLITADEAPELVLITDASITGWAVLAFDDQGREACACAEWSTADHATGFPKHSARAEPEAVYRAACRWIHRNHRVVHVITDSSTAVGAFRLGHSGSFHVNSVCARLNATFPKVRFVFSHVPGVNNPADGMSRGTTEPTAQEWDQGRKLADEAMGTT
jgi:hypothetical protein